MKVASMANWRLISETWETIKEVDLRPLRQQALQGIHIAILGEAGAGRHTLAAQLNCDPARPGLCEDTPVTVLELSQTSQLPAADLFLIVVPAHQQDVSRERSLARNLYNAGRKVLVVVNQFPPGAAPAEGALALPDPWGTRRNVVRGSVLDTAFLSGPFSQAVIHLLPTQLLSLGRNFPLFRVPIAQFLINDACLSNAAYALSTGLAETIAVLDIPITVADMIILSKNQAFLAYKLGLVFGFSTYWQDYLTEFGSVLGSGFLWRQLARTLVGLIPVWGLLPKIAVSYAGTYVVGQAILQWYLTGRHISGKQIQQLYRRAFGRGKQAAQALVAKLPKPGLAKRQTPQLPAPRRSSTCPSCGKKNSRKALYCQYCGQALRVENPTTAEIPLPAGGTAEGSSSETPET